NYLYYAYAVLAVCISTGVGMVLEPVFSLKPIDEVMIFLIGCVIVAARYGRGPAILYSLLSANFFNFFFVDPRYSLTMYERSYWTSLLVMLITSFVIAQQASQLRLQAIFARKRERDTDRFYSLTKGLASTRGHLSMATTAIQHIEDAFQAAAAIWTPDTSNH